jgi:hypothetical protein
MIRLIATTLLATLCACATAPEPAPAPADVPPRAFREIPEAEMRSTMGQLATHMVAVEGLLWAERPIDVATREALWAELDAMTQILDGIDPDALDLHHPQFGWRLRTLKEDIGLARVAIGANPPETYLVGTVTGSCNYCHPARRQKQR